MHGGPEELNGNQYTKQHRGRFLRGYDVEGDRHKHGHQGRGPNVERLKHEVSGDQQAKALAPLVQRG